MKKAFVFISVLATLSSILYFGQTSVKPSEAERTTILNFYGHRVIKKPEDLMNFQEYTLSRIYHDTGSCSLKKIDIITLMNEKVGLCYEKSVLMQKALYLFGIPTRPVFIFQDSYLSFFQAGSSDACLEAKLNDKWYFLPTTYHYNEFLSSTDSIYSLFELTHEKAYMVKSNTFFVPNRIRYIPYLYNRSGRLLGNSYWPDYRFGNM